MIRKTYLLPEIERIRLDQQVSLQLLSPPSGPGDEIIPDDFPFDDPEALIP